jgi:amino acid transporter
MEKEEEKLFVRKASGLVRVATSPRVFMFNIFWTAFGFVLTYVFFWGAITSPGADLSLGALLTTIFVLPQVTLYALFSVIMPRSGGDYHYVGRSLHPSLGFMVSFGWVIWLSFWAAWGAYAFTSYGLAPIVSTWGAITHNEALVNIGLSLQTVEIAWIIAVVVLVVSLILSVIGTEIYFKLQSAAFTLLLLAFIGFIALMTINDNSVFVTSFNNALNWLTGESNTYNFLLNSARGLGVNLNPEFNWRSLILLIPLFYTYMPYCMGSTFMAGEIKDVKKAQLWGGPIATIFLGLLSALLAFLFVRTIGYEFWYAVGNLWWLGEYGLTVPPYFPSFVGLLTNNVIVYGLISIGYLIWGVWFVPQNIMLNSRIMLAWSFDRIAPEKLSYVSEKFRTPIINAVLIFILAQIFLALYCTVPWLTMVSSIFALAIIAIFVGLAGIVFPFKRPEIFERSPVAWKIGGVPVLSVIAFLDLIIGLIVSYFYFTEDTLLANAPESLWMIFGIFLVGFILFWIAKFYRKTQGIDVELAFKEVPPE